MHSIDWPIVVVYLVWIVCDGIRRSRGTHEIEGYFLANRSLPWWAVGPVGDGDAAQRHHAGRHDRPGLRRRHALRAVLLRPADRDDHPLADGRAVLLTARGSTPPTSTSSTGSTRRRARSRASCSWSSRGLSCGVIIAAPAVILSIVLGWNLTLTVLAIGVPTTVLHDVRRRAGRDVDRRQADGDHRLRRAGGGGRAARLGLPDGGRLGRRCTSPARRADSRPLDFSFDLTETYTFWSGLIGGLFLMLSYFGCDQSQVQRYLTAKSVDEARQSLLMSAFCQDPAAGADPAHRRAGVRVLPVQPAADALQPRARARRLRRATARGRVPRRSSRVPARRSSPADGGRRPWRRPRRPASAGAVDAARRSPPATRRCSEVRGRPPTW